MTLPVLFVLVITEAAASVMTLTSTIIPNSLIAVFFVIALLKLVFAVLLENADTRTVLPITAATMFYDVGLMLKFLAGDVTSISELTTSFFSVGLGLLLGFLICLALYKDTVRSVVRDTVGNMGTIMFIIFFSSIILLFNLAICGLYYFKGSGKADGSVNLPGSFSFQLPELFKAELVVLTFITGKLMTQKPAYIWLLYGTSVVTAAISYALFKELGSILLIFYYTVFAGIILALTTKSSSRVSGKAAKFFCTAQFPLTALVLFFMAVGVVKRVLLLKFPYRGEAGEVMYPDNSWFNISSRLSADAYQVLEARKMLHESMWIQLNLNTELSIPYATPKTAVADYVYVMLAQAFGIIPAPLIFAIFAALIIIAVVKRGDLLTWAAAGMILLQTFIQFSGIVMHFCFTGLTVPFMSAGGSSILMSCTLLTFIIYSINNVSKNKEDEYE